MIKTGKMLLSGGLILASGSYAWWHHQSPRPVRLAAAIPAGMNSALEKHAVTKPAAPLPAPMPATAAVAMEAPAAETAPSAAETFSGRPAAREPEAAAKPKKTPAEVVAIAPAPEVSNPPSAPPPPAEPLNAVALAPQPVISTGRYLDGEFIGNAADGQWGPVQVKVVIHDGDIADVIALEYPIHRQRSAEISEWAIPQLREEAIKAQSADIEWITQASFTSENYQQSLASALSRARKQP